MDNWRRGGIDPATAGDDFLRNLATDVRQVQAYIKAMNGRRRTFLEPDFIVVIPANEASPRKLAMHPYMGIRLTEGASDDAFLRNLAIIRAEERGRARTFRGCLRRLLRLTYRRKPPHA